MDWLITFLGYVGIAILVGWVLSFVWFGIAVVQFLLSERKRGDPRWNGHQ